MIPEMSISKEIERVLLNSMMTEGKCSLFWLDSPQLWTFFNGYSSSRGKTTKPPSGFNQDILDWFWGYSLTQESRNFSLLSLVLRVSLTFHSHHKTFFLTTSGSKTDIWRRGTYGPCLRFIESFRVFYSSL